MNDLLLDHFRHPRNPGVLANADAVGRAVYPGCGDRIELYLQFADNRVAQATFRVFGCAAAIATASFATEWLQGRPRADLAQLDADQLLAALGGLPPEKTHAADLVIQALHSALAV